jgi:hypothetical protein
VQIVVPVPTFSRSITVPLPSLSRKQLMFMGGAAALGVVDVLSAPVAAVVAAAPLLQKAIGGIPGTAESRGGATGRRQAQPRRTSTTRGRSTARSGADTTAHTTRRPAARSSRRSTSGRTATPAASA